jgi:magnesium transporter
MQMWSPAGHHDEPILRHVRRAAPLLRSEQTVGETLGRFRREGIGDGIAYLYVVDEGEHLLGVVPARRLLAAPPEERIAAVMLTAVVSVPHTATLLEACEYFVLHRFLAFPVVDDESRLVGVIDAAVFTDEVLDLAERRQSDDLFEAIGMRVALVRDASPLRAFRFRLPWLLATIAGGTGCALLAGIFEATLAESLVLAFFLALVLGLGESVAVQSIALTVQALHVVGPSLAWYGRALFREIGTALLLGGACGTLVALIVLLWRGDGTAALAIGASIVLSLLIAAFMGLSVPAALHALRLDPRVAAGPIALALTDLATIVLYLGAGTVLLGRG